MTITQLDVVRPSLFDRIKADNPELPAEGYICSDDLDRFRSRYVSELLGAGARRTHQARA